MIDPSHFRQGFIHIIIETISQIDFQDFLKPSIYNSLCQYLLYIKVEARLKNWLKNTPVYLALQWFDVIEEVNVSSKLHAKRWTTELTERDRMFLIKLGMQVS